MDLDVLRLLQIHCLPVIEFLIPYPLSSCTIDQGCRTPPVRHYINDRHIGNTKP